jgi:hypothetical protein
MLGDLSSKYESGDLGFNAISSTPGDPGGPSYGKWQLSGNSGTLQKFIQMSVYKDRFNGLKYGTNSFNALWVKTCANQAFRDEQYNFIKSTHYEPVHKYWTDSLSLEDCEAINNVLWSISVQHGFNGCVRIMNSAEKALPESWNDADAIRQLYKARLNYVTSLNLVPAILASLINRYKNELSDALKLI